MSAPKSICCNDYVQADDHGQTTPILRSVGEVNGARRLGHAVFCTCCGFDTSVGAGDLMDEGTMRIRETA